MDGKNMLGKHGVYLQNVMAKRSCIVEREMRTLGADRTEAPGNTFWQKEELRS